MTQLPEQKPSREAHEAYIRKRIDNLRAQLRELYSNTECSKLTLEIGCGHGHFLTAYGQEFSDTHAVGVDLNIERIRKAEKKRLSMGLQNLAFVRANVDDFIEALPEDLRYDSVFMLFPDPWPKKRHWKNRMVQTEFLTRLAAKCHPHARFHFRTDHEGLFDWAKEHVEAHPQWTLLPDAEWPFEIETVFQKKAPSYQSLIAERTP